MISQKFNNGETEILIESAVTLQDAKDNNLPDGVYSRMSIDGKPINSPMELMNIIVRETQKTGKRFLPQSNEELKKIRQAAISRQVDEIKKNYLKMKAHYKEYNVPDDILAKVDEMIAKLDIVGMRTVE